MKELDLILRGGTIVTHEGVAVADVGIADGKIVAVGEKLGGSAREEIKADGLNIFPGVIDSHVHFNEPGRDDWEGIETGSRALVAGGGTMFFDMPLNAHPPTCDAASFDEKAGLAAEKSYADFALWGGLVPGNLHCLEQLAQRGVIGFKAFMSNSGIEDFSRVDETVLREGMKRAAQLGKLVAVHAESELITSELSKRAQDKGKTSIRDYLDSRPIYAELDAIYKAIQLAGETKCALHIVHVSSGAGVALVASAQKQGVDVTCETCPHYLVLTEEDVEKLGAVAKCAPPLRTKSAQDVLWRYLENGFVSTIGSDHSPSPPEMKRDQNFFKVWGGISGVQHTLPLLLTEFGLRGQAKCDPALAEDVQMSGGAKAPSSLRSAGAVHDALGLIARLTSFNVAERFKLPTTKGRIVVGADADLALVDLQAQFTVRAEDLLYRHRQSPYVGRALTGRVVRTILRGSTVFHDGKLVSRPTGQLVKPSS
jgi:allantoinase